MIDVQVGQHDALDVGGANADRPQLRAGFLFRPMAKRTLKRKYGRERGRCFKAAEAPLSTRITPSRCSMA